MNLDTTKPIYVRQSRCSRHACDKFVQGAAYVVSEACLETRGKLGLMGPAKYTGNNYRYAYMVAEVANCSNTPWSWKPDPPRQDKPLNDRIAELYLEAKVLLPDSLVPYYLKEALKKADGAIRFAQRKEQGIE